MSPEYKYDAKGQGMETGLLYLNSSAPEWLRFGKRLCLNNS